MPSLNFEQDNVLRNTDNPDVASGLMGSLIIGKSTALRKCMHLWKTWFFHMIDIAVVNSFILFQIHKAGNQDILELKHPQKYSVTEFRE